MSCPFKHLNSAPLTKDVNGGTVNKLVAFMQGSADAAFLLDREGKIIYRNKAAQLMFLTDVDQMHICSLFSFADGKDCWDDLAKNLSTTQPEHHDAIALEKDGTQLGFRVNLVKVPEGMMGQRSNDNMDVFACAYVIPSPLHTHEYDGNNEEGSIDSLGSIRNISKIMDDKLHSHMRDVLQASLDPMFSLFENGKIWMANDPATRLLGHTHSELVGKNISSICPEAKNLRQYMNSSSGNPLEATAIHKSGKKLPVVLGLRLTESFDGSEERLYFAHMKDLSPLEEHKAQIQLRDDLCQAMINASFDPMFGIDQRGKILVVNQAACSMFGYSREEFLGNNISLICNHHDAPHHERHMERYIRTGEKRVIGRKRPLVARRKDGTEFHIELGVSEVNLSNGEKMFCGYVRDMTQQRLDKQNLRRKDALIQEKFFSVEDARGGVRRSLDIMGRKDVMGSDGSSSGSGSGLPEKDSTGQRHAKSLAERRLGAATGQA